MPGYCLSIHADYLCRHSGACCTAGWRIPVEHACEERLMASGLTAPQRAGGGPALEREVSLTVLALAPDGTCAFFDPAAKAGHCSIHAVLGQEALPSACQHFPRVSVTDDAGSWTTLSHFCPTAAAMLFRDDIAVTVVDAPAAFHAVQAHEGLDARGVLPPLLHPGMLMDLRAHHAWQRRVVDVLANPDHTAESALALIAAEAEAIRTWTPGGHSLADRIDACSPEPSCGAGSDTAADARAAGLDDDALSWGAGLQPCEGARATAGTGTVIPGDIELYELVRASLLDGLAWPPAPAELERLDGELVEPAWIGLSAPVRHYLAAKAFASWIPWHGGTIRTGVAALAAARAVLRVESVRQCVCAGRTLDEALLLEGIRRADLLLVHQVSVRAMAHRLRALVEGTDHGPA